MPTVRGSTTVLGAVAALAGLLALGGCSAPTPICEQARALLPQGRLAEATALFARAQAQSEGTCASEGLDAAKDQYARSAEAESRGAAAEAVGDSESAVAAYQQALQLDRTNTLAISGAARVSGQAPPAGPTLGPSVPAVPISWRIAWPFVLIPTALILVLLGAGALLGILSIRKLTSRLYTLQEQADRQTSDIEALRPLLAAQAKTIAEARQGMMDTAKQLRSAIARHSEVVAAVIFANTRRDRDDPGDVILREDFGAPTECDQSPDAQCAAVDVCVLQGVSGRLVVRRTVWAPTEACIRAATLEFFKIDGRPDPHALTRDLALGLLEPAWRRSDDCWYLEPRSAGSPSLLDESNDIAEQFRCLVTGLDLPSSCSTLKLVPCSSESNAADDSGSDDSDDDAGADGELCRFAAIIVDNALGDVALTARVGNPIAVALQTQLRGATGLGTPSTITRTLHNEYPDRAAHEPLAESSPITVYVLAGPDAPPVVRHGAANQGVTAHHSGHVIIGDSNTVHLTSTYRIAHVRIDEERVLAALDGEAGDAFRRLIENPDDVTVNRQFRNQLHPSVSPGEERGAVRDLHFQKTLAVPVSINTVRCNVVAIGDHRQHSVVVKHRIATAIIDLAALLKANPELTSAFARQCGPKAAGQVGALDRLLSAALTPDRLLNALPTTPGRQARILEGNEGVRARYAEIVGIGSDFSHVDEATAIPGRVETIDVREARRAVERLHAAESSSWSPEPDNRHGPHRARGHGHFSPPSREEMDEP